MSIDDGARSVHHEAADYEEAEGRSRGIAREAQSLAQMSLTVQVAIMTRSKGGWRAERAP